MSQHERGAGLARFLERFDVTLPTLRNSIEEVFGDPSIVIATGSILAGFGNDESDVDVYAAVDSQGLQFIPLVTYEGSARVDARYFSLAEVGRWHGYRDLVWPPTAPIERPSWLRIRGELESMVRFAISYELMAAPGWSAWRDELEQPWLGEIVVAWWRLEAFRRQAAAAALAGVDDVLSAHRWGEAALAALEHRAATRGELFFGTKWLGERLRRVGDGDGLRSLEVVLRWPDAGAEAAYVDRCRALVDDELGPPPPALCLAVYAATGIERFELAGRVVISRWGLRGRQFDQLDGAYRAGEDEPWWQGAFGEPLPDDLRELVQDDLCWLSMFEAAS
ncbi:MAG: hypothetical protein JWM47_838 [Acidimicrobiales bacterium]|nr:hypothetical protein [Acidimicrobiales bacterium]